jgi:hypothetical protein
MTTEKENKTKMSNEKEEIKEKWKLYSCFGYAAVMFIVGIPIW